MNTTKKVMIGTLSGLAVGVLFGLLTAPQKGKDTRAKLALEGKKMKQKFNKLRLSASNELADLEEVFNHEIEGLKEDVRQRVLNLIEAQNNKKIGEPSLS
jgi:gas vesicle protein